MSKELKDLEPGDKAVLRTQSNWEGDSYYLVVVMKKTATRLTVGNARIAEATFTLDGNPYPRSAGGQLLPATQDNLSRYEYNVLRRKVKAYSWKLYDVIRSDKSKIEKLSREQLEILAGTLEGAIVQLDGEDPSKEVST